MFSFSRSGWSTLPSLLATGASSAPGNTGSGLAAALKARAGAHCCPPWRWASARASRSTIWLLIFAVWGVQEGAEGKLGVVRLRGGAPYARAGRGSCAARPVRACVARTAGARARARPLPAPPLLRPLPPAGRAPAHHAPRTRRQAPRRRWLQCGVWAAGVGPVWGRPLPRPACRLPGLAGAGGARARARGRWHAHQQHLAPATGMQRRGRRVRALPLRAQPQGPGPNRAGRGVRGPARTRRRALRRGARPPRPRAPHGRAPCRRRAAPRARPAAAPAAGGRPRPAALPRCGLFRAGFLRRTPLHTPVAAPAAAAMATGKLKAMGAAARIGGKGTMRR
jgi:hypothetical protein